MANLMGSGVRCGTRGIVKTVAMIVALVLPLGLSASPAWAGPPTDQLRDGIDRIFKVLMDPDLKGDEKASQRKTAVTRLAGDIFDFGEMSKRTLGRHWDQRTPADRQDFARLFTELIQRSYFSRVDEHGSEKTVFRGETMDGDHAIVRTTLLLARGSQMPLDYAMHNPGGRWRVYDISIDGISLVANYRSQFNRIIRTSSYADLVARMTSNQTEFSTPSASPSGAKPAR
jgi:phospholipid transport system substrate-binding protein